SPRACSRPAVSAGWWPKLRDSATTLTRGSSAAAAAIAAAVPSFEPSSTRITTCSTSASAACTRARNGATVSSSSYIGATTLSRRSSRAMDRAAYRSPPAAPAPPGGRRSPPGGVLAGSRGRATHHRLRPCQPAPATTWSARGPLDGTGAGRTVFGMVDDTALERELFEVGKRLAEALPSTRNPLKAIDDKAMDLASSDAELKAALFRFVDVVPACRSLDDLARHLTGFLGEVEAPTGGWAPIGVAMKMGNTKAGRRALGLAAAAGVRHMAHRFIVGESPKAALGDLRDLWKDGVASSVDLLGEATVTQAEAQRYADRCVDALETIATAARG